MSDGLIAALVSLALGAGALWRGIHTDRANQVAADEAKEEAAEAKAEAAEAKRSAAAAEARALDLNTFNAVSDERRRMMEQLHGEVSHLRAEVEACEADKAAMRIAWETDRGRLQDQVSALREELAEMRKSL